MAFRLPQEYVRGSTGPPANISIELDYIAVLSQKSMDYFDRHSLAGDLSPQAEYVYGMKLLEELLNARINGGTIMRQTRKALQHISIAATLGFSFAQNKIGDMYLDGDITGKSTADAKKWYELAAEQGNPEAQFNLALVLEAEGDQDGRIMELTKSASTGYQWAIDELATISEQQMARSQVSGFLGKIKGFVQSAKSAVGAAAGSAVGGVSDALAAIQRKKDHIQEALETRAASIQKGAIGLARGPAGFAGGLLAGVADRLPMFGRDAKAAAGQLTQFSRNNRNRNKSLQLGQAYENVKAAGPIGLPSELDYAEARRRGEEQRLRLGQEGPAGAGGGAAPEFAISNEHNENENKEGSNSRTRKRKQRKHNRKNSRKQR